MKRMNIVLCLLIFGLTAAMAQKMKKEEFHGDKPEFKRGFFVGFTLGANAATGIYHFRDKPNPPDLNLRVAPVGGFSFDWRLGRHFSFQMNLLYKGKGDNIKMQDWLDKLPDLSNSSQLIQKTGTGYIKNTIHYGEFSLLPVITIGKVFQIGAGGYVAAGFAGKEERKYSVKYYYQELLIDENSENVERTMEFVTSYAGSDLNKRYMRRFDYGLCFHTGLRFLPFNVNITACYGMNPWEPKSDLFSNAKTNETKNLTGGISLSYYLGGH